MSLSIKCQVCKQNFKNFAVCDSCSENFCKLCSTLSVKEFNCAALTSRKLKFYCQKCDTSNLSQDLFPSQARENITNNKTNEFITKEEFVEEVSKLKDIILSTKEEITNLKDSNIDLVRLLTSEEYLKTANLRSSHVINEFKSNSNQNTAKDLGKTKSVKNISQTTTNNISVSQKKYDTNTCNNSKIPISKEKEIVKGNGYTIEGVTEKETFKKNSSSPVNLKTNCIWGSRETDFLQITKKSHKFWIFTSGYSKLTTPQQIIDYLKQFHDVNISCEKIQTRNEEIASFKVGIPNELKDQFLLRNLWPLGAYVNKYFAPRGQKETNNFRNLLNQKN